MCRSRLAPCPARHAAPRLLALPVGECQSSISWSGKSQARQHSREVSAKLLVLHIFYGVAKSVRGRFRIPRREMCGQHDGATIMSLALQMRDYRLTTAEILYHMPDHPSVLQ